MFYSINNLFSVQVKGIKMGTQVYTELYCVGCNEPVKLVDVVREGGYNWHKDCLSKAKGSTLWTGLHEPGLAD